MIDIKAKHKYYTKLGHNAETSASKILQDLAKEDYINLSNITSGITLEVSIETKEGDFDFMIFPKSLDTCVNEFDDRIALIFNVDLETERPIGHMIIHKENFFGESRFYAHVDTVLHFLKNMDTYNPSIDAEHCHNEKICINAIVALFAEILQGLC